MRSLKEYFFEAFDGLGIRTLVLYEELNPTQKKKVDGWTKQFPNANVEGHPNAVDISSHVIPPGQHKIVIPLNQGDNEEVTPHPEVDKHLKTHGYSVSDYRKGMAKDKYGRDVSIGKILNKTKASPDVMNAFTNDPKRKGTTKAARGLSVVISRHPHHIAGMSTDQGWTSCMNMKDGCNKHYLKRDIAEGTHVAYLVHDNDTEVKKPIARIALKPFRPTYDDETSYAKPILRPEIRMYGDADSSFTKTVNNWAEKNFPAQEGHIYEKSKTLYHDGGREVIGNKEALLSSKNPKRRILGFDHENLDVTHEDIDRGLDDSEHKVRQAAASHPNASKENLDKAMSIDDSLAFTAANHRNISSEHLDKLIYHPNRGVRYSAAQNDNLSTESISKIMSGNDTRMREYAIKNRNATQEHIHKALDGDDIHISRNAMRNNSAGFEAISKGLRHSDPGVRRIAYNHPNFSDRHIDEMTSDINHPSLRMALSFKHPRITGKHIENIVEKAPKNDRHLIAEALSHQSATPKAIDMGLDHESDFVRHASILNPNASPENIDKALSRPEPDNRHIHEAAFLHPNMTSQQIHRTLDSGYSHDISRVMRNRNVMPEHVERALNSPHPGIRESAMLADNATHEQVQRAANDPNEYVAYRAKTHRNFNKPITPTATKRQKKTGQITEMKKTSLLTFLEFMREDFSPDMQNFLKNNEMNRKMKAREPAEPSKFAPLDPNWQEKMNNKFNAIINSKPVDFSGSRYGNEGIVSDQDKITRQNQKQLRKDYRQPPGYDTPAFNKAKERMAAADARDGEPPMPGAGPYKTRQTDPLNTPQAVPVAPVKPPIPKLRPERKPAITNTDNTKGAVAIPKPDSVGINVKSSKKAPEKKETFAQIFARTPEGQEFVWNNKKFIRRTKKG